MKDFILHINTRYIFAGIILLSIVTRFYLLGINPPSLDWDEASIGYNAYSILHTARDEYGNFLPLSFRSFDDYKPPVYIYLTVPSVALFGLTEFAVRFPAAIVGVLAVVTVYFLTQEIFYSWGKNKREWISLLAAFFLCISPWHLQFSRAAFEGNVGMFFLILSLLCFFKAFIKPIFLIPYSLFFILSLYSYHSFRLIGPLLLVGLVVLFFKQLVKNKYVFFAAFVIIVLFSIPIYTSFISPQGTGARLTMVTIFSDPELLKQSAQKVLAARQNHDAIQQILYNRRVIFIPQMIKGYFDHFDFSFLFLRGDGGVQHHAYNMGMLYLWDFPFILLGIYLLIRKIDRRIMLLLVLFLLGPLPASITSGTPQPIRAIGMIPAFQIFTAVGFMSFVLMFAKYKRMGRIIIGAVIVLLMLNVSYYFYSYYILTPVKYGYFWQYGNKQAILYAKDNEARYEKIIMSYEYDQPYIYYLFYNKIDPSWYQKNWDYSKNGTVDRFYRKIGKYEFRNINFQKDQTIKDALLIGTPKEISVTNPLLNIHFPDGRVAYVILSTK